MSAASETSAGARKKPTARPAELDCRAIAVASEELDISLRGEQAERTKQELGDSTLLKVNLREQYRIEAATRLIEAKRAARAALANFCAASGQDLVTCMVPTTGSETEAPEK